MTTTLRYLQVLALGTWVGSIIYLSFIVAPGIFTLLSSRQQAGTLVGLILGRLHVMGYIAGAIYLAAAMAQARSFSVLLRPPALAVILMLVLTVVSQQGVSPRMAALRTQMGSVDRTPLDHPLRVQFDRLHRVSMRLEGGVLLLGLLALFLTVRQTK